MILSILLSSIFILLGIVHLNWVFGGKFGFTESLPTKKSGERVLNPKRIDSAIVGTGLTLFGIFYIFKSGLVDYYLSTSILMYGGWIIPGIFILRAIGEFQYVGFFKKIRTTNFGKLDTKFISPLCLVIGILGIIVQVMK